MNRNATLLLLGLVAIVPIAAWIDLTIIGRMNYVEYLFQCAWELGIMLFGFTAGRISAQKEW